MEIICWKEQSPLSKLKQKGHLLERLSGFSQDPEAGGWTCVGSSRIGEMSTAVTLCLWTREHRHLAGFIGVAAPHRSRHNGGPWAQSRTSGNSLAGFVQLLGLPTMFGILLNCGGRWVVFIRKAGTWCTRNRFSKSARCLMAYSWLLDHLPRF